MRGITLCLWSVGKISGHNGLQSVQIGMVGRPDA